MLLTIFPVVKRLSHSKMLSLGGDLGHGVEVGCVFIFLRAEANKMPGLVSGKLIRSNTPWCWENKIRQDSFTFKAMSPSAATLLVT